MAILRLSDRAFYYGIANFHEYGHAWLSTAYNLVSAIAAHRLYRNPKLSEHIPGLQLALLAGDVVEIGFGLKTLLEKFSLLPSLDPTEWNNKQIAYFGVGSLAILSAGYAAVRILRKTIDHLTSNSDLPGVRNLDFSQKNLFLARMVLNTTLAYFSSNRMFYLCNIVGEAYSLFTLSKLRHLEFSKTFPNVPIHKIFLPVTPIPHPDGSGTLIMLIGENSLQVHFVKEHLARVINVNNIQTKIETNYRGLFFPYTGPSSTECAVCLDEKPEVYFCSNQHAFHLKCVIGFIQAELEKPINFQLSKILLGSNKNISLKKENLPNCPQCRGLPFQIDFKLYMESNLNAQIDYDYFGRFREIRNVSTAETRQFPVQFEIDAPKVLSLPLFSEAFFNCLSLAYNGLQAALATMQHLHPELSSAIFTAQKVFMVVDSLLLAKNYFGLLDEIQKKYKIKLGNFPQIMGIISCTLAAISAFAIYQLNSRIAINLNEIVKEIDSSMTSEPLIPFVKKVIEWLYINRIIVNLASTFFVSKDRLPIHLMNIGLQAVSLFKFSYLLLPFIEIQLKIQKEIPVPKNDLERFVKLQVSRSITTTFDFTLPFHPHEKACSLNDHLHAAIKSIHEYCSDFFKNSRWQLWSASYWGIPERIYWKVEVQPPSLNPTSCGLVPIFNGVECLNDKITILNK